MLGRTGVLKKFAVVALLLLLFLPMGCGGAKAPDSSAPSTTTGTQTTSSAQPGVHFRFIVCGDPQNQYEVFDKILEAAKSVDFLLITGDLTGSGTPTELQNFANALKSSGVRYYCVPGNHDIATGPAERVYSRYFGPANYSFDYQNSHFLMIDNSVKSLGFYPQEQKWAADDLKAAHAKGFQHVFAVCHVPPGFPYSSRPDPEEALGMKNNEQLVPVLSRGGVEELFCGHYHAYEQDEEDGMLVTITGGAGAPLHAGPMSGGYHHYILVDIEGKKRKQEVIKI